MDAVQTRGRASPPGMATPSPAEDGRTAVRGRDTRVTRRGGGRSTAPAATAMAAVARMGAFTGRWQNSGEAAPSAALSPMAGALRKASACAITNARAHGVRCASSPRVHASTVRATGEAGAHKTLGRGRIASAAAGCCGGMGSY